MNTSNNRILLVDDNRSIHDDFRKILGGSQRSQVLVDAEAKLFGQQAQDIPGFELTSALQGEEAVELARTAQQASRPFALAFVDLRMPPGIDGITTATRLWAVDPDLQVVICSAHADYTWNDMAQRLGLAERWVILKKPFDNIEVLQLAHALAEKWMLRQQTKAHVADLERRVAMRTADLQGALERLRSEAAERLAAEEERRAMERKVEETQRLESLGVLAGGIAHDFNNILTGILGSASLARLTAPPDAELNEHLARIEENAKRAAQLCEQMLAYAGKGQVVFRVLDVNSVLRETLELIHISVPKDAEFKVDLGAAIPAVCGDAARLRQVFMNLVLNAAEALAQPPRKLSLRTTEVTLTSSDLAGLLHPCDASAGRYVRVEMSDTGVGIPENVLRRIFEPFYTTKFTGRGLGLCAVLGIVRSHGGALHISSEPGRGSVFRVYLPSSSTPAAPCPATPVAPVAHVPELPGRRGTLLVVDDEQSVRDVAAAMLRRQGFDVVLSPDGAHAVAQMRQNGVPFVAVVLDLTMPQMDGVATLQQLRELRPGLPALLMSGYNEREALGRFQGMERVTFLQKPFTLDRLLVSVRRSLEGTPAALSPQVAPASQS